MMTSHMGLGTPEREFYPHRSNPWPGYVLFVLLYAFLISIVIATTPAGAWQKNCPWPCFEKHDPVVVRKARSSVRHQIRPASKRLASSKVLGKKRAASHTVGFVLSPKMIKALIRQESAGKSWVRSRNGATGLMQIMPATAKVFARRAGHPYLRRASYRKVVRALKNPRINLDFGRAYLKYCFKRHGGNRVLTLICYNAGPRRSDYAAVTKRREGRYAVPRQTYKYVRNIFRMSGHRAPPLRRYRYRRGS